MRAASLTSYMVRSGPPVMVKRIPRAPSIPSSSSGESTAALAASVALFSPLATPIPIKAEPVLAMMALTSAKSTLISPGTVTSSEMP